MRVMDIVNEYANVILIVISILMVGVGNGGVLGLFKSLEKRNRKHSKIPRDDTPKNPIKPVTLIIIGAALALGIGMIVLAVDFIARESPVPRVVGFLALGIVNAAIGVVILTKHALAIKSTNTTADTDTGMATFGKPQRINERTSDRLVCHKQRDPSPSKASPKRKITTQSMGLVLMTMQILVAIIMPLIFANPFGNATATGRETGKPFSSLSAGHEHTVAIRGDGVLWSWGRNQHGQLGDGTTADRRVPVQIMAEANWATVCAGWHHTVAVRGDGTLWAWGGNDRGQLGDGTTTDRAVPVQIGGTRTGPP